jgi:ketosteroid isomerase-like protein
MKNTLIIVATLLLFSCSQPADTESIKQELINTDLAFSKLSLEKGKNHAFLNYIHDQGALIRKNGLPYVGKSTLDSLQKLRPDTAYTLKWKPLHADAAQSGEMGYTYGVWQLTTRDTSLMGTYFTVWKKDEKGNWKFILDGGNDGLGEDMEKMKDAF